MEVMLVMTEKNMFTHENESNNTLELLHATSTWVLMRHQWLIDNMRSILTGEDSPPLAPLYNFDKSIPKTLKLNQKILQLFTECKNQLETLWQDTIKASHPSIYAINQGSQSSAMARVYHARPINRSINAP
jgi:hypothetical protein